MREFAEKFYNVLHGTLSGLNLTAIRDFDKFYSHQIIDSVLPLENDEIFLKSLHECGICVDIGFGGGFPLLPLAYKLKKKVKFLGFESVLKKVEAVKILKKELDLDEVKVYQQRLENIFFDKKCVITLKAVGKCDKYLKRIQSDQEIYVFFYKGPSFYELEGDLLKEKQLQGSLGKDWELIDESFMKMEGTDGRLMIGFKKKKSTNSSLERKHLVKVSQFL